MAPNGLCQQSFFTFSPYAVRFLSLERFTLSLLLRPGLQGGASQLAHLVNQSPLYSVRVAQFVLFICNRKQCTFQTIPYLRVGIQTIQQFFICQWLGHGRLSSI